MRLGQLSRKLSVRSADIVDYLAKREIEIEDSVNARVDEPALGLVLSHFAPELNQPTLVSVIDDVEVQAGNPDREDEIPTTQPPTSLNLEMADMPTSEVSEQTGENTEQDIFERQEGGIAEEDSVIRAPKVELKGLKVLGKIELPEPKKKEEEAPLNAGAAAEQSTDTKPPERPGKKYQSKQAPRRTNRNPVTIERERQAKEQAEKKKKQAELEKERRKQHYSKRVKVKGPTKAVRIYEDHVVMEPIPETKHETWWRKFVRWLTSY